MNRINNKEFEVEDYSRIIDHFQIRKNSNIANDIRKYQSYIKLVKTLERNNNKKNFSNKIILLLALSEETTPDRYHTIGDNIDDLSNNKKDEVYKILKYEFQLGEN